MADVSHIFLAYDIRGKVGSELNPELCTNVGRAFADWLPESGKVAVGYDMRPDSKELAEALIRGLQKQGRDVISIGQVTSDMIYFAVGNYGLAGGAMVTASHNPGEYNGIKLCREKAGGISLDSGLSEIRDNALGQEFNDATREGSVEEQDVIDEWISHALTFAGELPRELSIAVDAGNGMAGKIVPHLQGKVPLNITPLYFELDGTFPNHEANPLKFETLADLQKTIQEENLDGGVAFDGDGDRALLVDEKGEPISGSVSTAIIAQAILEKNPGATILYNANVSNIVPETVEKLGGTSFRTPVGHSLIKQKMKEHNAVFAGEHSAHYYFRDNWNADSGLIAALTVLGIASRSGKKLSELADQYRVYAASGEINFDVEDKQAMMNRLEDAFDDGEVDKLDGLTIRFSDWWFIVRPSNTEPKLRLNVEANNQDTLEKQLSKLKEILNS